MPDPNADKPVNDDELYMLLASFLLIRKEAAQNLRKITNCMDRKTRRRIYDLCHRNMVRNTEKSATALDKQIEQLKKLADKEKAKLAELKGE